MLRRFVMAAGVTAMGTVAAFGQNTNARIEAMGGCDVVMDVTKTMTFPACMLEYPDYVQGTINPAVGPLIGIKSFGDVLSAGAWYDAQRVLRGDVYTYLGDEILGGFAIVPAANVDPIPHFLVGMDFTSVKLAIDLFYERAYYTAHEENTTAAGTTITDVTGRIHNPGLVFGLNVDPEMIDLKVALGASLPMAKGVYDNEVNGATVTHTEGTSASGVAGRGNVELNADLSDMILTVGLGGSAVSFQGEIASDGVTPPIVTDDKHLLASAGGYLGLQHEFTNNEILIVAQGNAGLVMEITDPDAVSAVDPKTTDNAFVFGFNAGLEKAWRELTFFDVMHSRCGLTYGGLYVVNRESGEDAGNSHELRVRNWTDRSGFGASFGGGLGKGIFQFDVAVGANEIVNMFKLVNGTIIDPTGTATTPRNDFVKATLTLDFSELN